MIGNAASATLPGVFDIDYNYDIRLDFCARTGSLSGINEGYPSYTVRFERETVLDWHQETLLSLLGDGEIPAPLRGKFHFRIPTRGREARPGLIAAIPPG